MSSLFQRAIRFLIRRGNGEPSALRFLCSNQSRAQGGDSGREATFRGRPRAFARADMVRNFLVLRLLRRHCSTRSLLWEIRAGWPFDRDPQILVYYKAPAFSPYCRCGSRSCQPGKRRRAQSLVSHWQEAQVQQGGSPAAMTEDEGAGNSLMLPCGIGV